MNTVENVVDFLAAIRNPFAALLGHFIDRMTDLPTLAVTSTSEIPTLSHHTPGPFKPL